MKCETHLSGSEPKRTSFSVSSVNLPATASNKSPENGDDSRGSCLGQRDGLKKELIFDCICISVDLISLPDFVLMILTSDLALLISDGGKMLQKTLASRHN